MRKQIIKIAIASVILQSFIIDIRAANSANPGDLIINEIMNNPAVVFDLDGEWFELYNPTARDININRWTIEDNDIDSHVIDNGGPLVVPSGGYLVLGKNGDFAFNGGVVIDYKYGPYWHLTNRPDEVVLFDGDGAEIDRVEYDYGPVFPDPIGASMALLNPALDNNVGSNWCTASTVYGDGDMGTPGEANDCTSPGDLIINEIMNNPAVVFDLDGEWFELYNPTARDININRWTIEDNDIDSHVIDNGGPLVVPSGGYLVLGKNGDFAFNGGVVIDYEYGPYWHLANKPDEVVLFDGDGAEIDRVEYDYGPVFPDPIGASMALLNPALDNNVGSSWCTASTVYGDGDMGTPGEANDCTSPGDLIINEIMNNPAVVFGLDGEWFELYNPTARDININRWTIEDIVLKFSMRDLEPVTITKEPPGELMMTLIGETYDGTRLEGQDLVRIINKAMD